MDFKKSETDDEIEEIGEDISSLRILKCRTKQGEVEYQLLDANGTTRWLHEEEIFDEYPNLFAKFNLQQPKQIPKVTAKKNYGVHNKPGNPFPKTKLPRFERIDNKIVPRKKKFHKENTVAPIYKTPPLDIESFIDEIASLRSSFENSFPNESLKVNLQVESNPFPVNTDSIEKKSRVKNLSYQCIIFAAENIDKLAEKIPLLPVPLKARIFFYMLKKNLWKNPSQELDLLIDPFQSSIDLSVCPNHVMQAGVHRLLKCKHLTALKLSDCNSSIFQKITTTTTLTYLELVYFTLDQIVLNIPNIRTLILTNCHFSSKLQLLEVMWTCPNLEYFKVVRGIFDFNRSFLKRFPTCLHLKYLNFSETKVQEELDLICKNVIFSEAHELHLFLDPLGTSTENIMSAFKNCSVVSLTYQASFTSLGKFQNLIHLELNKIQMLPEKFFSSLWSLQKLKLSSHELKAADILMIFFNPYFRLQELDLKISINAIEEDIDRLFSCISLPMVVVSLILTLQLPMLTKLIWVYPCYEILDRVLPSLPNLSYLHLQNSSFFSKKTCEIITVHNTKLKTFISQKTGMANQEVKQIFEICKQITELRLDQNLLDEGAFKTISLSNIEILHLDCCGISLGTCRYIISNATKLKTLSICNESDFTCSIIEFAKVI